MAKFQDLTGKRFGKLLVLKRQPHDKYTLWLCQCDCGWKYVAYAQSLKKGVDSCGCNTIKKRVKKITRHGMHGTFTYRSWDHMIQRCTNKKNKNYKNYGGRGINVCSRWKKFINFYEDMGERPENKSIERIDNDKGYSHDNCKWATNREQSLNKRNNANISYKGETKTLKEWSEIIGIESKALSTRLERGWNIERAFETPKDNTLIKITYKGKTMFLHEWAALLNMARSTVYTRYIRGWSIDRIIETPLNKKHGIK